ncbi:hypothetical protein [Lewinella cohaerens]|uniref:hypothetical protein n=1 Tax=Lewinella cohaerens TaxID=70995 RepID=UPI000374BB20|nr:hypothetical protein [Lewinella cohaerens]
MKYQCLYILSFLLLISTFSCKKDYEYESELIPPPSESDFFVEGEIFYQDDHSYLIDFKGGESVNSFSDATWGSTSMVREENDKKYIASGILADASAFRVGNLSPINRLNSSVGIYVKISSDRPASEIDRKFTKEELEELLKIGREYDFGTAPGEVEVGYSERFRSQEDQDLVPWNYWRIEGTSADADNENSAFRILEIEPYEDNVSYLPARGFKVKVAFDAVLQNRYWIYSTFFLENVEGVFFFEYE